MENRTKQNDADAPFSSGHGGAVDDLTPPTMKGMSPTQAMSAPNSTAGPGGVTVPMQPETIKNSMPTELEGTLLGTPRTIPIRPHGAGVPDSSTPHAQTGLSASAAGSHVATVVSDVPTQDLSGEKLLRDAPRLESGGMLCPSLNGIPLLYKLGQGGMGAVYYGVHPRLRSEVAVKVLPFQLAEKDPGMIQRFFREAQIAAKVRSPHLVSVIDVNEESGLFFLVMEYVAGCSMGQYLKKEIEAGRVGMSELDAIDATIAACMGLDAAHSNGIIHRDLKPDNIMCPYKSRQHKTYDIRSAKLMDLGLARSEEGQQSLTGVQAAMGTPGYMAPEQALDAKTADKRSDIFGMGATLYAFLAGRPPFKGDVVMKVLMATMHEPHPPITEFRPDLHQPLVDLINRCLDKRPENRYADARQLIRALRAVRKAIAPDTTFGGEDDGGEEENDTHVATSTPAPLSAELEATRTKLSSGTVPPSKSGKTLLFVGLGVVATLLIALGVVLTRGKEPVKQPEVKLPTPPLIPAIEEGEKKRVLDKHARVTQGIKELIDLKKFDDAKLEIDDAVSTEEKYRETIPSLAVDMTGLKETLDTARKADRFDAVSIQIDVALKNNQIDEAQKLSEKLDPANSQQKGEKGKKLDEIKRADTKRKNKVEFNNLMLMANDRSLTVNDRLDAVKHALDLENDEPNALDLRGSLIKLQEQEKLMAQFKKAMEKAKDEYVKHNYEVAYDAVNEAKVLQPSDKSAQDLAKQIYGDAGPKFQEQLNQKNKQLGFAAYNKAKEFFDKKDTEQALEQINLALNVVKDEEQYFSLKQKIELLQLDQKRTVDLARRKKRFEEYIVEASESFKDATEVRKAAFLDHSLEVIHDAKLLKLDDVNLLPTSDTKAPELVKSLAANLNALEAKVLARQGEFKTRIHYDELVKNAKAIYDDNSVDDGKMETIVSGIKKLDEALAILGQKNDNIVTAREGIQAEDLKKKYDARKAEIADRDQKRVQVNGFLAQGQKLLDDGQYPEAKETFKKAEQFVVTLSGVEKNAVLMKVQEADDKLLKYRAITLLVGESQKLLTGEQFDTALSKITEAEKIMPDKRVPQLKAEIIKKKVALDALVKSKFTESMTLFQGNKLADAVLGLQTLADEHPSRADVIATLNGLKKIQGVEENIAVQSKELTARFTKTSGKPAGDITREKERIADAFAKLPKLIPELVEKIASVGISSASEQADVLVKRSKDLIEQASLNVGIVENKIIAEEKRVRAETEARKPPPPPPPPDKKSGGGGEITPDLIN